MKIFWRIFLSFWLATVLMIAALLSVSEVLMQMFPEDHKHYAPALIASDLTKLVNVYEEQGPAVFIAKLKSRMDHDSFFLFNQKGSLLAEDGVPLPFYAQLAEEALQSGYAEVHRLGFRTLFVCPVQSETGRRYAVILSVYGPISRLFKPHFWFNLTIAMFPAALVCMALSFCLTRPITRLRATAQRLATGDLSARAAPPKIKRRDELGDLARDFDVMAAQIEMLMTAQRRFVADVSHELGAPLTRMHLALALLRRQFAGKKSAELERIERETDKLSNLVQQLLLLAGLEAGRCPAETLAPLSLQSLCESIIHDANFEAEHANCRITGTRQDITLLAYPQMLRRAIDNVLRNAIRYSPAGSTIHLDCRASDDRQQVIVEILDCGPGVPESMLADIFQPFFRTAPGRESSSGGAGLGLAIASEGIHLHGGSITAQNRKNGGLQVTITLPLRSTAREEDLQQALSEA